ncbi:MAG: nucleotidyltransferase domain-containing protein [Lachnospiraceae bacterium]|nr:nucleotidyltransferase domain-containing protein [Lachnospiraceae bacterium]
MGKIKEMRLDKNMTQQEVADLVGISLRSYKSYENDENKEGTIKYKYIIEQLEKINFIDEDHGVLTIKDIEKKCSKVLEQYDVSFCYLFGSYAKDKATPTSDVDLLLSSNVKGLKFYGLVEELRIALRKRVDVLDINQLKDNLELTEEILKDGVRIYG